MGSNTVTELKEQDKDKCTPNKREENKIVLHFNKKNIITQSHVLSMFILGITDFQYSSKSQLCKVKCPKIIALIFYITRIQALSS